MTVQNLSIARNPSDPVIIYFRAGVQRLMSVGAAGPTANARLQAVNESDDRYWPEWPR